MRRMIGLATGCAVLLAGCLSEEECPAEEPYLSQDVPSVAGTAAGAAAPATHEERAAACRDDGDGAGAGGMTY